MSLTKNSSQIQFLPLVDKLKKIFTYQNIFQLTIKLQLHKSEDLLLFL